MWRLNPIARMSKLSLTITAPSCRPGVPIHAFPYRPLDIRGRRDPREPIYSPLTGRAFRNVPPLSYPQCLDTGQTVTLKLYHVQAPSPHGICLWDMTETKVMEWWFDAAALYIEPDVINIGD